MKQQPHHVLVYRLSALGDVAMTIPAIYSCARTWPDTTFHVVTTSFCAQLFVRAPQNVVLHPIEKPVGTWRVLKSLHKIKVDAVADLHNVLRSWIVDTMFRLRGKRVVMLDKKRDERKGITQNGKFTNRAYTQRYFDVFAKLGFPCEPAFTSLFTQLPPIPVDMKKGQEKWVGIAPFARYDNKTYSIEKMQEVVQLLADKENTRVFLFGSRGEQANTLKQWEQLSPRVHSVADRFNLNDELALMAHLDCMVSMDSANMHMASLTGTRVVSVWGSTTPACGFMGWQQQEHDAVYAHLDCQPCAIGGSKRCKLGSLDCMKKIQPSSIIKTIHIE